MYEALLQRTLILSPHADDEVLGCGGLMHSLRDTCCKVHVVIAVAADSFLWHHGGVVAGTTRQQETRRACGCLGVPEHQVRFLYDDGDGKLDTLPQKELVMSLDLLLRELQPTAVFLPYPSFHQDHRALFQAAFAALRPRLGNTVALTAMYEYPNIVWQYDQLPGADWYVRLDDDGVEAKVEAMRQHASQVREGSHVISPDSIRTWARYRGMEIGVPAAERFRVLRAIT